MGTPITITEQTPQDGSNIIQAMNDFLIKNFNVCYDEGYKFFKEFDNYSLYLYINNQDRPLILSGQFENDKDFICYVIKEMKERKVFLVKYFRLYRTDEQSKI